jgi:hypothetical protein
MTAPDKTIAPGPLRGKRRIRTLPEVAPRIESGPVRFGSDYPGLYLRGEDAFAFALVVDRLLAGECDDQAKTAVRNLVRMLDSAVTGSERALLYAADQETSPR